MARRAGLIAGTALALLAHGLALDWLAAQWQAPSLLQAMAKPVLTRLIAPAEPVVSPPVARPVSVSKPALPLVSAMQDAPKSVADTTSSVALDKMAQAAPPPPEPAPLPPPPQPEPALPPAPPPSLPTQVTPTVAATTATAATPPSTATAATATLASWPTDTRLTYKLRGKFRGDLYGDASVQWQREGSRYQVQLEMDIALFLHFRMTSQGEVDPTRLRPTVYEEIRRNRTRAVRLGEREVTLDDGRRLPRPPGVQDTVSQFVDLSHRFASGLDPLRVGSAVSFWMARPGGVDLWTYDVVEQTTLYLATLGPVQAFHLKPRPIENPRGNISAEMWFAPSLQYLPVRILISQGPEIHLDLLVDKIEQQ